MKLFDVYPLFDVNIVKGKGCKVWDDKGQEYLDLYGGHAVISIGHSHPHYISKVTEQLQNIGFYSNSVINKLQVQLAERLGKISGYDDYQLFLINSGAEANENALKLASFKTGNTRVLSCEKAFHGRTSLAVEVTNNPKIVAPINDNHHVRFLPLNDLEPWVRELSKGGVAAVILECIQGVGGIQMATPEFAQGLAYACKRYGAVIWSKRKVLCPPVVGHQARYYHCSQGHCQRIPNGWSTYLTRIRARLRTIRNYLWWKPSGMCSSTCHTRCIRGRRTC